MVHQLCRFGPKAASLIEALPGYISRLRNHTRARCSFAREPIQGGMHQIRAKVLALEGSAHRHQPDSALPVWTEVAGDIPGHLARVGDQNDVGISSAAIPDPRLIQVVAAVVRESAVEIKTGISVADSRYRGERGQVGLTPLADRQRRDAARLDLPGQRQTNVSQVKAVLLGELDRGRVVGVCNEIQTSDTLRPAPCGSQVESVPVELPHAHLRYGEAEEPGIPIEIAANVAVGCSFERTLASPSRFSQLASHTASYEVSDANPKLSIRLRVARIPVER